VNGPLRTSCWGPAKHGYAIMRDIADETVGGIASCGTCTAPSNDLFGGPHRE
jgi:hypothetical protein